MSIYWEKRLRRSPLVVPTFKIFLRQRLLICRRTNAFNLFAFSSSNVWLPRMFLSWKRMLNARRQGKVALCMILSISSHAGPDASLNNWTMKFDRNLKVRVISSTWLGDVNFSKWWFNHANGLSFSFIIWHAKCSERKDLSFPKSSGSGMTPVRAKGYISYRDIVRSIGLGRKFSPSQERSPRCSIFAPTVRRNSQSASCWVGLLMHTKALNVFKCDKSNGECGSRKREIGGTVSECSIRLRELSWRAVVVLSSWLLAKAWALGVAQTIWMFLILFDEHSKCIGMSTRFLKRISRRFCDLKSVEIEFVNGDGSASHSP